MATAIVRCPNCGSVSNRTSVPDEYVCSHCNAKFKFVRPGDRMVTYDVRTHSCPICGGPVEAGKGFRCIRCGRFDVCGICAHRTPKGHICLTCLREGREDCVICGNFALFRCASCLRISGIDSGRACVEHASRVFFHEPHHGLLESSGGCFYYCPTCQGWICRNCATPQSTLSVYSVCKGCGTRLSKETRTFSEMVTATRRSYG